MRTKMANRWVIGVPARESKQSLPLSGWFGMKLESVEKNYLSKKTFQKLDFFSENKIVQLHAKK